jgi:hypothetical protein
MTPDNSQYLGLWYGTIPDESFDHYVELVIFRPENEKTSDLHIRRKSKYWEEPPTTVLSWDSSEEFHCTIPHWAFSWPITIHGKFHASASILTVTFTGSIFKSENYAVNLRQSDPAAINTNVQPNLCPTTIASPQFLPQKTISLPQTPHLRAYQYQISKLQSPHYYGSIPENQEMPAQTASWC